MGLHASERRPRAQRNGLLLKPDGLESLVRNKAVESAPKVGASPWPTKWHRRSTSRKSTGQCRRRQGGPATLARPPFHCQSCLSATRVTLVWRQWVHARNTYGAVQHPESLCAAQRLCPARRADGPPDPGHNYTRGGRITHAANAARTHAGAVGMVCHTPMVVRLGGGRADRPR